MDFRSLVERKLDPVGETGNDIIYRCPKCDDNSGHLYIDYDKGYWHCFKCNYRGRRLEALLRDLHIEINYDYTKIYNERESELENIISPMKKAESAIKLDYSTDLEILTQYYNEHTMPLTHAAYEYLLNRGITAEVIASLNLREGMNNYGKYFILKGEKYIGRDYSGRIMIPSKRKDGNISFYVGRDYIGDKMNKYVNPPKELAVASEDVWSLDILEGRSVIICEGVMTAISVNEALGKLVACATYGKSIAHKSSTDSQNVTSQGEKLLHRNFDSYILFYDKDAYQESCNTAKYLHDRGAYVRQVRIVTDKYGEKADANDMSKEEIIKHIMQSKEYDSFSGLL